MSMNFLGSRFDVSVCGPPDFSGVYMICVSHVGKIETERVVYIGSSKNIQKRLLSRNHLYLKLHERLSPKFSVYTRSRETDNYLELEKLAIKYYKPLLNKRHKNG